MKNSLRTQALAEGALMASITAILGLAGIYLPFIRIFTDMLWTIPIVLVTTQHGLTTGGIALGVAGILIFALGHPLQAVFLLLQFGALALFYGVAFQKRYRPAVSLLIGTGITLVSLLLVILLTIGLFGIEAVNITHQLQESIEPTIQIYDKLGFFDQSAQTGLTEEMVRQLLEAFTKGIALVIPAMFLLWALSTSFFNYLLAQVVLLRFKISIPVLPPFREWQLPWWIVWGFIAGFAAFLIGSNLDLALLAQVGMNIMLLYAPIFFVLGLSVVSFFVGKYFSSTGARLFIVFLAVIFLRLVFVALLTVGLLDLLLNYRHLPNRS